MMLFPNAAVADDTEKGRVTSSGACWTVEVEIAWDFVGVGREEGSFAGEVDDFAEAGDLAAMMSSPRTQIWAKRIA